MFPRYPLRRTLHGLGVKNGISPEVTDQLRQVIGWKGLDAID